MKRENLEVIRTILKMNVEGRRGRRPKKKWFDAIRYDMTVGVCVGDVRNYVKYKFRTQEADPY